MPRLAKIIATAALAALALGALASPASANPVTTYKSGSYGRWGGTAQKNVCGKDWFSAYVHPVEPWISRAPAYVNYTQTIRLVSRIDYWTSSGWVVYRTLGAQTRILPPNQAWALFSSTDVTVASGRYYRVVQFYDWFVNGVRIGTVTNLFDQSEYTFWGPSVTIGATGTQPSYCYIR